MDANSREFQRQAIDAEIKSLESVIRALRHRRNAVAPILSLPTEIIATIFSTLRLFDAPIVSGKSDLHGCTRILAKVLIFHKDERPGYCGTFTKRSRLIKTA